MQDRVWFFAAVARWGSRVNQPGAYLQPAAGQVGQSSGTATLFYPGQPGTPYANVSYDTEPPGSELRLVSGTTRCGRRGRSTERQPIQLLRRHPEVVPLHDRAVHRRERDRIGARLGLVAVRRGPGHVAAPVTSRLLLEAGRVVADRQLGELRRDGVTRDDRSILETAHELPLRRGDHPDGAEGADRPQRAALLAVVRHRQHNMKVGVHQRAGIQRRVAQPQQSLTA